MPTARACRRLTNATIALAAAALALPATALAGSGGGGLGGGPEPVSGPVAPPTSTGGGSGPVSTAGGGVTLHTKGSAMLRRRLTFSGTAAATAGKVIEIERSGRETHWQWAPTVSASVDSDGSFHAVWHVNHIGRFAIRAVLAPSAATASRAARTASGSTTPAVTVTIYRPSRATLYGPGFYRHQTACGERLTPHTIGLANRTLRCGEKVALYYHGKTLKVPVIDRGPYANGADWDLTMATGRRLGLTGTAQIGAVSLPRPPAGAAGSDSRR